MANNNDWLIKLVGSLDEKKTKDQINEDIEKIQGKLKDVELKAKLGSSVVNDLEKQLNNLQVSLSDVTIPKSVLNGLVNQINNALRGIQIPNISTGGQAQQAGQQYGQQFRQGFNSAIQKGNLQKDFFFSANDKNDVAKRAQQYFRGISNGIVTVNEQMERLDDNSELRAFTVNIKNARGEIESLRYSLRNITDDNGNVTGQVFSYTGGSINDVNVVKEFAKHQKTVTDFTIKLEKLKATYANANVDYSEYDKVFKRFENGTASVNELRLAFNKLESDIKTVAQGLKSQSASLDPIQQALNNMRDLPSMLTTLQSNMDGIKDKTSIASISVQDFTDEYNKLQTAMTNNGGKVPLTQDWVNEYQSLMSSVTSATKQVDALKKAEASDNSSTQKQANYYSTILSNYREIYSLKKKLIIAGEEETKVIKEQIRSLNASNASIYKQIGNQGLKDTDWQKQIDDLENELKYSLRISEAHQKDKTIQSNLNDEQRKSVQIINELEQAYQRVQDIKIKISSLDKERDSEKITTLSKEESSAQEEYNKLYDKLRKRKNYDKDIWKETKSAIDDATKSQIEYNNAKSQDALNKVQKTELTNFRTLKDRWDKQGVLVGEFKIKVEQLEASLASVGSKGELDNLKTDIKDLKLEATQLLEANREYEKAEKELTATLEKRRVAQANSAKEKAKSNAQQELAQQREVNAILSKQESAYKEIWNINKQISKLDETEDSDIISVLNEKKKFYQDIYLSAQKELQAYNNIVVSQEHLASLAEIRKKAESEIGVITAKQSKTQADEVNKIQHSLDVGDYDAQIETIKKGFVSLSGSADEAETHVDSLRKALQAMHDATDNDSKILAEKNYRLELEKTQNELTISKAKAKEYVDTFKVNKLRNDIQDWLKKNTAATKEAKDAMQLYLNMLDGDKVSPIDFNTVKSGFDDWDTKMRQVGKLGKSLTETFKEGAKSFATWAISSGAVMEVVNVVRQGVDELKDLDDILTEISKTSDLTKQELTELGLSAYDTASKYGREASDYLSGVQSMSQSGFYGEQGKAMAEQSLLAQAASDMSQEIADKYIIATNAAYKFNGEATKLNAVLDGQNSIANQNSVALEDMATAMSEAGTVASSYNVAVEDFSAMVGTIESVTKSGGSEVGNALKSILINLQNVTSSKITGTLEKANASMTEFVNGTEQLRNPIDILRDLAVTFNSLEDSDPLRAEVLTNVAGKYQSAKLAALLENMTLFDKMLVDYSEGSGSALEEANKSATNLTGSLNTLKNSTNELINVFVSADGLKSGVNVLNALTQGATGLVEALSPLGTIATIGSGILGAKGLGLTNYVTQS